MVSVTFRYNEQFQLANSLIPISLILSRDNTYTVYTSLKCILVYDAPTISTVVNSFILSSCSYCRRRGLVHTCTPTVHIVDRRHTLWLKAIYAETTLFPNLRWYKLSSAKHTITIIKCTWSIRH